jgi:hypothetical protein
MKEWKIKPNYIKTNFEKISGKLNTFYGRNM